MKTLADALVEAYNLTTTENGETALKSTTSYLLDFYGVAGAMRNETADEVVSKFIKAFREDPLNAMKLLFYTRDIRGGVGERRVFKDIIKYLGETQPDIIAKNIELIPLFGRYDDLYCLVGTKSEPYMWKFIREQFDEDVRNMELGRSVTLLAKWLKTPDSNSEQTRKIGLLTAKKLGFNKKGYTTYCKNLKRLRKYIGIVESKMADNNWNDIDYSSVPSRAMMKYRNAFKRHDEDGYEQFMQKVMTGEAKVHADTVTPYDIIHRVFQYRNPLEYEQNGLDLEATWKSLPDVFDDETNILCVVDTSGSMAGRPIEVAVGLGLYFAERNKGIWNNKFINFSNEAHFVEVPNGDLHQKVTQMWNVDWQNSTNIEAVMNLILWTAIQNELPQEAMPKGLLIISDMQFNSGSYGPVRISGTFHEKAKAMFKSHGYTLPNIIYWNVRDTKAAFQVKKNEYGVQLASGESIQVFKQVVENLGTTPYEAMMNVLNSERYSCVTV